MTQLTQFKENIKTKTTVKVLQKCIPSIKINPEALIKMKLFVEGCSDEIGWLGIAYKDKNVIYIEDVFLFEQNVHGATTEITPEGLSKFAEAILQEKNGMDVWNNLKVWGHSHVNMGVLASSQDDTQMETFSEGGHNWFIRIIANKRGEMKVDLYSYELGIIYEDLSWEEAITQEEMEIEQQISQLYKFLDEIKKSRINKFSKTVEMEIKDKVKKKTYNNITTTTTRVYTTNTMENGTNNAVTQEIKGYQNKFKDKDKKKPSKTKSETNNYDTIRDEKDVYNYLDQEVLLDIGECENIEQVEEVLEMYGYSNFFNMYEMRIIWNLGRSIANHIYFNTKL